MKSAIEKRIESMLEGRVNTVQATWTKGRHFAVTESGLLLHVDRRGHVSGRRGDHHYAELNDGTMEMLPDGRQVVTKYLASVDVREGTLRVHALPGCILPPNNVNKV